MSDSGSTRVLGPKALEMIMRDVLGGMEDLAAMKAYQPGTDLVEIIAIEPADPASTPDSDRKPRVVDFNHYRRGRTG